LIEIGGSYSSLFLIVGHQPSASPVKILMRFNPHTRVLSFQLRDISELRSVRPHEVERYRSRGSNRFKEPATLHALQSNRTPEPL
jgi:hypothetical protein